ncbi:MAG TPA: tetratricopeptide repeat-containing glycosyltransferase family protein [Tepidisphaeraceae bacterium]|nr:tetratricopeptide repeat-containing glycosyltransferase family protein [Tepidisphaeraceae bacterium]
MSDPTIEQQIQQAMQLQSSGKTADAEQAWRQILQKEPNNTTVLRILGSIFGQTGRSHEAVELLGRCVIVDPGDAAAHSMLGASLAAIGHKERAIQHLSRAVELQPTSAHLHYNYGKALRDQKQNEAAAAEFRKAIELQVDFPPAWNNLANTLRDLGSLEEAYAAGQRAIALRPGNTQSLHNLGVICRDLLKLDEAMRLFDTALAYDPAFHECRLSRAMLLLLRGQYTLGWNEYEARFDVPRTMSRKEYGKPVWDGQDPEGRTVLLYCEQGFGDAIQFARYVPILAERGASVIVECRPELVKLFGSLRGVNQIVTPDEELPDFDAYRGLLSMPMISGTTVETIPADVPYLRADRTQSRRWKRIIDPGSGARVGLVWAGAAGYGNDHNRSIALEKLAPLAEPAPDARFYSLQKGEAAKQALSKPAGMKVIDLSAELNDFADTAAAIENLDLVISVDTAVAHLAGALGKPTWLMIPFSPDWRWMLDRSDTPWYPSMRLFRQASLKDWDTVIQQVADAMASFSPS